MARAGRKEDEEEEGAGAIGSPVRREEAEVRGVAVPGVEGGVKEGLRREGGGGSSSSWSWEVVVLEAVVSSRGAVGTSPSTWFAWGAVLGE